MRAFFLAAAVSFAFAAPHARAQSAASELIDLWTDANSRCRGRRGDDPRTDAACEERGRYSRRLERLGFCYGEGWRRCGSASPREEQSGARACVVDDPTPTPLNYRSSPNGSVLGSIENGKRVTILESTADPQGRVWVYIADADKTPLGWVFRRYVACR